MSAELKAAIKRSNEAKTKPVVLSDGRLEEMLMEQADYSADALICA